MKAYLIDPFEKKISEVEYDGNYKSIYTLISTQSNPVDIFTCVELNEHQDTVFVDDEGLLNNTETQHYFKLNGHLLAGKGLVLGTNDEGDSVTPFVSFEKFQTQNKIEFLGHQKINHEALGFKLKNF